MAQLAIIVVWAALCFGFFQTMFSYHFFYQEQNLLFPLSADYIESYFSKPAWLACMAGDFITQFYHYTYIGAAVLTLSLVVMGDVVCRCLKRVQKNAWVAFGIALAAMTLIARLALHDSYKLESIIAIIGGCSMWWLMDIVMSRVAAAVKGRWLWIRIAVVIVCGFAAYWMFGYGGLLFIFFEILRAFSLCREHGLGWQGSTLPVAALAPLLLYVIPFAPSCYNLTIDDALCYPGLGKWVTYADAMHYERVLVYDNEYYFGHYPKVIQMYESTEADHCEETSFFYCLSLEQTGMLASKLPEIKDPFLGTFLKISETTPLFQIKMINEMYYLLGDMTYTERAALLANTFSPEGRNARMLKRLAEANLVSGDEAAAMKYLRLLSKTIVYRKWAADHMPATQTAEVKAEIERKHQFLNTTDNIRLGDDCYVILTQLLDSNPKNTTALDYLLCSDMLAHQRDVFIHDYEKYGPSDRPIFQQIYNSAVTEKE